MISINDSTVAKDINLAFLFKFILIQFFIINDITLFKQTLQTTKSNQMVFLYTKKHRFLVFYAFLQLELI